MRKFLISLLLAGAAASPAFAAQDRDTENRPVWGDRQESHPERNQVHAQIRTDAQSSSSHASTPQQPDQPTNRQRADGVSHWTRDTVQQSGDTSRWTRDPTQRPGETERWTRDRVGKGTGNGFSGQDAQQAGQSQQGGSWNRHHDAQPQAQAQNHSRWKNGGWNRSWRNDAHYDWRRYRDHHRSIFHLGIYYDPFGFGYRPFDIGYHLGPAYYGQQYWIDPATYSLPYPPSGTAWVRYWNDAVLVDIYTGEIVDVIHDFFW